MNMPSVVSVEANLAALRAKQSASIATLESKGFRFVCWFDAHDGNDGQCATMQRRRKGLRCATVSCEVDPDGTCNGQSVADFLASVASL